MEEKKRYVKLLKEEEWRLLYIQSYDDKLEVITVESGCIGVKATSARYYGELMYISNGLYKEVDTIHIGGE